MCRIASQLLCDAPQQNYAVRDDIRVIGKTEHSRDVPENVVYNFGSPKIENQILVRQSCDAGGVNSVQGPALRATA